MRKDLRKWLKDLHKQTGHATLFVTHDQDEALEFADRMQSERQPRRSHTWQCDGSCNLKLRIHDGSKYRKLTVVDGSTLDCVSIRIDRKLKLAAVIDLLFGPRRMPRHDLAHPSP